MGTLISIILSFGVSKFLDWNPILIFLIIFISLFVITQIINEIRWYIKRNNGFLKISIGSDEFFSEDEKYSWLEFIPKNEYENVKIQVIAKRITNGRNIGLSELSFVGNGLYLGKDIVLTDYPVKVNISSICENYLFFKDDGKKHPIEICLYKGEEDSSIEKCEIFFEIKGLIDDKYRFSEFYKGTIVYECSTEPDIFTGSNEAEVSYRGSTIKWESFKKWSKDEEDKRPLLREMRNVADKMSV